jgi:hypothetical protein
MLTKRDVDEMDEIWLKEMLTRCLRDAEQRAVKKNQSPHLETIRRMASPEYHTLLEIGSACKPPITRERVRQLIASYGIQRAPRPAPIPFDVCADCGRPNWSMVYSRRFCQSCRSARSTISLTCANPECGRRFRRRFDQLFQGKNGLSRAMATAIDGRLPPAWCSHSCWGKYRRVKLRVSGPRQNRPPRRLTDGSIPTSAPNS